MLIFLGCGYFTLTSGGRHTDISGKYSLPAAGIDTRPGKYVYLILSVVVWYRSS